MYIASWTIMLHSSGTISTGVAAVNDAWIADRMKHIDASGIRKAFDMAKSMKDPINLSIGLPDFDVADPVKAAAIEAIERGHNAYTVTQGIPELRDQLQAAVDARVPPRRSPGPRHLGHLGRPAAGALLRGQSGRRGDHLRPLLRHVPAPGDPGRGTSVLVDTYPDFRIDTEKVAAAHHVRGPNASWSTRR